MRPRPLFEDELPCEVPSSKNLQECKYNKFTIILRKILRF